MKWTMIDRWDVDGQAEDMIVKNANGKRYLLVKRQKNVVEPATWCIAFSIPAGETKKEVLSKIDGEYVSLISGVYEPMAWEENVVRRIALDAV